MRRIFLLLALPLLAAEDASALLANLARASAPAQRMDAMKALQALSDQKALQDAWAQAVRRKGALGLGEEERATLWMERVYWGIDWRQREALARELQAFRKDFPSHPSYVKGLKAVMDREARYGTLEGLEAYLKAFAQDLPEPDRAKYADRVQRFRAGGEPLPLTLKDWDGKPFDLASLKGRPVLLYFWSSG